ncbi:MAG: hypothetical protein AB1413_02910 [Thermodesulfobacteriota bacterium]
MKGAPPLTPLRLTVPDLHIGPSGVAPFCYPVTPRQTTAVLEAFIDALHQHLREKPPEAGTVSEALWIMFPVLCLDVIQICHSIALLQRCKAAGYQPRGPFLDALAEGVVPPLSRRLAIGLRRPPRIPAWRQAARFVRSLMPQKGWFDYHQPYSRSTNGRPLIFHQSSLLANYAREQEERPLFTYPEDWLMPGERISGRGPDLSAEVRSMAKTAFAAGEETPSDVALAWLVRSASLSARWGAEQLAHLRSRRKIPKHFWVGTLGNPVYRVLSKVVRERGGEVTGFDHGMSSGLWDTPVQTVLEFDFADRFVTFSREMAAGLHGNWQPGRTLTGRCPELVFVRGLESSDTPSLPSCPKTPAHRPGKIIYVPTMYGGETVHLLPFFSDIQMVDWQARLLSFLRGQGYEVSIKPHPESVYPVPAELAALVDGRVLAGRFEDLDLADSVLLFDYPQTTAFVRACRSSNPIVVVDFGRLAIRPEARQPFAARCALVEGGVADDGRLMMDWQALVAGLEMAPERMDQTLGQRYFAGVA